MTFEWVGASLFDAQRAFWSLQEVDTENPLGAGVPDPQGDVMVHRGGHGCRFGRPLLATQGRSQTL